MYNLKNSLVLIVILIIGIQSLVGQDQSLYIPKNIQQLYDGKTRSQDGKPGEKYWQNYASYSIQVELEPETRRVIGSAIILYENNSPDTLDRILLNLYQDLFRKGNMRDFSVAPQDVHDGVIISKVNVNKKLLELNKDYSTRYSMLTVYLPENLLPDSKIELQIDWEFVMPQFTNIRYGTYDETNFFVAYWYPAVAVYDDIEGWNRTPFSGTQEFYHNFGEFNVDITMPAEYLIWATGELQNPQDVLKDKYYKQFELAKSSNEIVHIVDQEDLGKTITKGKDKNTWTFKAEKVVDFAFGASKSYLWDATSALIDRENSKRVFVQAAYDKTSMDFYNVASIAKRSIHYFNDEMPAIQFPYPVLTVFNGGGGMEFPMIVNDGSSQQLSGTVHVTSHEIAHQYLPFYMGTNEQKYAWMDEGWAVMLPLEFQEREAEGYKPLESLAKSFSNYSGTEYEVPPMILSSALSGKTYYTTYRIAAYTRPALAYEYLKDMLGEDRFKAAMQEYVTRWHGKHPIPYDFFFTFNDYLKTDLNWFWNPWFFESGYPDLEIGSAEYNNGVCKVTVNKKGTLPVPVALNFYFEDGKKTSVYYNAGVWKGTKTHTAEVKLETAPINVEVGNPSIPDVNKRNNRYEF